MGAVNIGALNQRIEIQYLTDGVDEIGQPVTTWATVCTVWANISDVSGREYVAAGAIQDAANTRVTVRYREGLTSAMRVLHGASTYNIEAVLSQDKKSMALMCKKLA